MKITLRDIYIYYTCRHFIPPYIKQELEKGEFLHWTAFNSKELSPMEKAFAGYLYWLTFQGKRYINLNFEYVSKELGYSHIAGVPLSYYNRLKKKGFITKGEFGDYLTHFQEPKLDDFFRKKISYSSLGVIYYYLKEVGTARGIRFKRWKVLLSRTFGVKKHKTFKKINQAVYELPDFFQLKINRWRKAYFSFQLLSIRDLPFSEEDLPHPPLPEVLTLEEWGLFVEIWLFRYRDNTIHMDNLPERMPSASMKRLLSSLTKKKFLKKVGTKMWKIG